jgi:RHS repeat-associated protein
MGYPDPSTNRLMSTSGGPAGFNFDYRYDLQGNIIQRGTQSYVFDQGNRMTSAPGKASYAYDGLGHRISVVGTDGVNRVQVYSQVGQLMYTVPTGSAGTRYIYMHNHMLAEVGPGGVQYDHTDGLGSPVARTDANRALISQTRYEPYGYTAAGAVPGIGFTGHVNDVDTALVYMQQRYYDPVAGRFLSIDPVTTDEDTGDSFNRYAYAENNPYRYVDPDGRQVLQIPLPPPPPTVTITGKRPRSDPFASPVQSSSQQGDPVARKLVEIYNNLTSSSPAAPPPEDDKDKKKKKEEAKDGKKLKKLSPGEIRGLEREGLGAHELKSSSSRFDIYKDSEGNLYQMLKGGKGEPSSLNINIRNL